MFKIVKTTKQAGRYVWEFSNGHSIVISHCPELREWHLFANDDADRSYEPVHPFHDTFGEAKSYFDKAYRVLEEAEEANVDKHFVLNINRINKRVAKDALEGMKQISTANPFRRSYGKEIARILNSYHDMELEPEESGWKMRVPE